jgi:hypothetical protein
MTVSCVITPQVIQGPAVHLQLISASMIAPPPSEKFVDHSFLLARRVKSAPSCQGVPAASQGKTEKQPAQKIRHR